jgi:hypothetical protein
MKRAILFTALLLTSSACMAGETTPASKPSVENLQDTIKKDEQNIAALQTALSVAKAQRNDALDTILQIQANAGAQAKAAQQESTKK